MWCNRCGFGPEESVNIDQFNSALEKVHKNLFSPKQVTFFMKALDIVQVRVTSSDLACRPPRPPLYTAKGNWMMVWRGFISDCLGSPDTGCTWKRFCSRGHKSCTCTDHAAASFDYMCMTCTCTC